MRQVDFLHFGQLVWRRICAVKRLLVLLALLTFGPANQTAQAITVVPPCRQLIWFVAGSAELSDKALEELNSYVMRCDAYGRTVVIRGYSDALGTEASQLEISRRRAESVRDYLLSTGFLAKDFQLKALGKEEPIAPGPPENERINGQNRRVLIYIEPPPDTSNVSP